VFLPHALVVSSLSLLFLIFTRFVSFLSFTKILIMMAWLFGTSTGASSFAFFQFSSQFFSDRGCDSVKKGQSTYKSQTAFFAVRVISIPLAWLNSL
jgi:hypothetical protein